MTKLFAIFIAREFASMGKLDGKVAVVTGAASGLGRASALRFAGEGAAVVIADLNQEGGEAAVRDCRENGGRAVFQKADVSDERRSRPQLTALSMSSVGSISPSIMLDSAVRSDRSKR
jgi:NAD(P)-dependent dehydrogenase (short-subunit alcohol dehydrogenase family)